MSFSLPELPFAIDALEPYYDSETIAIHHTKHHQTYTDKLNAAVEAAGLEGKSVEDILTGLDSVPEEKRGALRNHGGGYWNHGFFWESLAPKSGGNPTGPIAEKIATKFGNVAAFQDSFSNKAALHFGSGWAWLVVNAEGELEVTDTHDQISPISLGQKPILTIDVWEHAYYLKYRNMRPKWIEAWWSLVNWEKANERLELALK